MRKFFAVMADGELSLKTDDRLERLQVLHVPLLHLVIVGDGAPNQVGRYVEGALHHNRRLGWASSFFDCGHASSPYESFRVLARLFSGWNLSGWNFLAARV